MSRAGVRYMLAATAVAVVVLLFGFGIAGVGAVGVWVGVLAGLVFQVALFWLLVVVLFPQKPLVAYGLGVAGRFLLVGLAAFVAVPLLGLPPGTTLFSLVAVLFVTTLLEPVFFRTDSPTGI